MTSAAVVSTRFTLLPLTEPAKAGFESDTQAVAGLCHSRSFEGNTQEVSPCIRLNGASFQRRGTDQDPV